MLRLEDKPIPGTAVAAPLISGPSLLTDQAKDHDEGKKAEVLQQSQQLVLSPQVDDIKSLSVPKNLEDPTEVSEKTDPLEKFKPLVAFINKIKFPLAGAGAMSHLVAAIVSVVKLIKPDSGLAQHEGQALMAANIYSKYMSFIPLAVNSIKNLLDPKTFWSGIAQLSPMSKILAGHVSNLPFFTGGICAYNAYDRYLKQFFKANPHIKKHETDSQKRLDHLLVILKNTSTIVTNSFKNLLKGEGDFLQNLSATLAIPGFGLPYFYGLVFARHDKLNHFVHKLVRSSRSIVGLIEDFSMAKSPDDDDAMTRIFGRVFCAESGMNSMSPWFEPKEGASAKVDLRNPWGNLAAMIAETGNLLYTLARAEDKELANLVKKVSAPLAKVSDFCQSFFTPKQATVVAV
ncbi:MAG: hypothetical protein ACOYK1_03160 [Vampirovibrionia bacterium]